MWVSYFIQNTEDAPKVVDLFRLQYDRSVEPLIEHIKEVFRIDPLPVRGHQKGVQ